MVAWLTALPKTKAADGKETVHKSRMEGLRKSAEPELPPLTDRTLFDWLMEIGPTEASGMGRLPISWATIDAWARLTGTALTPWKARTLRRLSVEYLAESVAAEDPGRLSPWKAETPMEVDRDAMERQHDAVFGRG